MLESNIPTDQGTLYEKEMKAVLAQVVSCCVMTNPNKISNTNTESFHTSCSSPYTKELHVVTCQMTTLLTFQPLPEKAMDRVIMHIDMDCFFVSVGLRNYPHLRGHPVAVTHAKGGGSGRPSNSEV